MFSIIVAKSKNNMIGKDNKLLWHIPEDLKLFKELTNYHKIFMGRKTFESLPGVLVNRKHLILTKDEFYPTISNQVELVHSLEEFIEDNKDTEEEIFVIGGGTIYSELMPYCKKLYVTEVLKEFNGDTSFPSIGEEWKLIYKSEEKNYKNLSYMFTEYTRVVS